MVNRKRDSRKSFYLSKEEREAADELKENIKLGLIDVPRDHELYNLGVRTYPEELERIRRGLDTREKPLRLHPDYMKAIDAGVQDQPEKFQSSYTKELARLRGEKVQATDRFGFPKFSERQSIEPPHGLDDVYLNLGDRTPELQGLLEYYSLTTACWNQLLPETQIILKSLYAEKTRYGV